MKKFEYKREYRDIGIKELNQYGEEGWEVGGGSW